jgi:DNA repair protein RadC
LKENAMNLSSLSHAELEIQLLATTALDAAPQHDSAIGPATTQVEQNGRPTVLAHKLRVARELILRDLQVQMQRGPVMQSPQDMRDWLRIYYHGIEHEEFLVLYLTAQHALIDAVPMFRGTLTQASVYPREVVKTALALNSGAVVLAHNHPGGHPQPSRADEYLTQSLKAGLNLVDVRVLDHFIVVGAQTVSMAELGLM